MATFTERLWASISGDIFVAILEHPFLDGLRTGELPEACFRHYVQQDSLYLKDFGKGLAILAAKADTESAFLMFCEHARNTLVVEGLLHQGFAEVWEGMGSETVAASPTTRLYTGHLIRTAYEQPYHEALAAFLPCYLIYRRVGMRLLESGSPNPLYQRWIDTYGGDEFGKVVEEILGEVDRVGAKATADEEAAMFQQFRWTSECEYRFWDMGYRQETCLFGAFGI